MNWGDAMGQKKILLVEDDQDIRETLVELLQEEGYEVFFAENGQVGLDKLSTLPNLPNLILLDLMMPIKDGFQFCLEKEANPKFSHVPVVVMSADGHIRENQKRVNACAYLKKPLDIYQVIDIVARCCL
jgi:DNA-binding response OmpR family regulator